MSISEYWGPQIYPLITEGRYGRQSVKRFVTYVANHTNHVAVHKIVADVRQAVIYDKRDNLDRAVKCATANSCSTAAELQLQLHTICNYRPKNSEEIREITSYNYDIISNTFQSD
jgi:hypothetical protein